MEDLDFPVLDAPPARTEISVQKPDAPDGVDLRKIDLKEVALAGFGPWRDDVAAVTANLSTLALDLSTQTMVDAAKSLRFRLIGQPRADLRKVSKGIKSKLAQVSKDVGAEEEAAVAAYDKAEELITPQIEAREAQLAAQKAERDRIEAERVQKHKERIDIIRSYLGHAQQPGMTSERIAGGMTVLAAQTFPKSEWEEFDVQAANAQCETLEAMRVLHAQVLGREQEAARQEAIRLENERQAEANRIERERIAAELAEIRRATEALEAKQAAARKAAEDKAKAEAEEKAQAEAVEAARKKALEAPAAVLVTYDADTNKFAASAFQPDTEITEGQAPQPLPLLPKPSISVKSHPIHGFSYTPEYRAWQAMRKRCTDPEHARWADYGGRGITVCDRWISDVVAFIADMGAKPSDEHELDRIDNDGGYSPDNCRWVLRSENNRNKSNNRIIEWKGQQKTLVEWCEIVGISYSTLRSRIDSGWSVDRAMTEPTSPDATDREAPATTSLRVGAMGAGQAADAAPVEPTMVLTGLMCVSLGISLTGYITEDKFDEIKAIFLTATQGAK